MSSHDPISIRSQRPSGFLRRFIASEASGGLVLMAAAALALIVANSPLAPGYFAALHAYVGPLSLLHWINDALMAVFFLMVGLEIKREVVGGQLATWQARILPGLAALGGMAVPALFYLAFNIASPESRGGWAIPSATDIAFALGVLSLLGPRVPVSLKVFLAALAIIDDLGAVLIIAFFYTSGLNLLALAGAALVVLVLALLNRRGVLALWPYLTLGLVLWVLVFLSGIHATLAGVVLALTIPLVVPEPGLQEAEPPLLKLEHAIQPWVAFLIVPVFGFANAGVSFAGFSLSALSDPVPLGIAAGLFFGKQIGVFGMALLAIRLRWASLPERASWRQVYGVSLLCGIGFTMSLFIGLLAFPTSPLLQDEVKLGVLMGSLLSGLLGAMVLRLAPTRQPEV
ncbi:pH-dependent sodium/proton antiporter [Aureimonas ureilytica]|uniref:Na(+)/H(+) antiporter NhaA n=1 Tax=Aureimonas ureilytica TaxID=401562 RepID=A0A175RH32_9HYPH|nr:Na+/H+ antiporter NhaA [Aureimonas ureilytica]KTR02671.1 pH-dependent sodium/proton antiporter [Aureimonas ureilytica]